jgi:hypothetical protein
MPVQGEIQVHQTPNPNARKFVLPGWRFAQPLNYSSAASAAADPLAARLFALAGVYNVLTVKDFVTVNKLPQVAWEPLAAEVVAILTDFLDRQRNPLTSR